MLDLTPPVCASTTAEVPDHATTAPAAAALRGPRRVLLLLTCLSLAGVALALLLGANPLGQPDPRNWMNAFFVLFARTEPLGLALVGTFSAFAALWIGRSRAGLHLSTSFDSARAPWLIALAVLAIAAAGTTLVFHQYALTADENMADFQARIFLSGQIHQRIPDGWEPLLRLIMPTHATYLPAIHSWMSGYLPVYAAIRAVFMSIGLQWFTNPVLAAVSVLAIAAVARRIWPNDTWKPVFAAALLAVSPQFLVTSMTGFAMPAHLALNLIWLWLYSAPEKRRFWLAPLVGVAAMGLHQPFYHALFATPFLLRLVLDRRWKASVWFAAIYLLGIACWYGWWHHFVPANAEGAPNAFALHRLTALIQSMNLLLVLGWIALPLPLLAAFGFSRWRQMSPLLRDVAASCILTFALYIFVGLDQGHGWGYRYLHAVLGCLVLVAVAGWDVLAARIGERAAMTFALVGLATSLLLQLPLRAAEAEAFVRPYARAAASIQSSDADVVLFDPRAAWYSNDLKRNDPLWQTKPMVISTFTMRPAEALAIQTSLKKRRLINQQELAAFGLQTERVQ